MEDFRKRKAFEKVCKRFAWFTFQHLRKVTFEDVRLRHTKKRPSNFFLQHAFFCHVCNRGLYIISVKVQVQLYI